MSKGNENKLKRIITSAVLVLSLVVSGSAVPLIKADAAPIEQTSTTMEGKDSVIYQDIKVSEFKDLFGVKAPEKDGYYFGGWYETGNETKAIKYSGQRDAIVNANKENPDAIVYAKFVPSYMLNVKAQNASSLNRREGKWEDGFEDKEKFDLNNKTSIRMISAIDSTRYKEVGFHVFVNGKKVSKMTDSVYNKTVYDNIVVSNKSGQEQYTAEKLFGHKGKLIIAKFINIPENGWKTSIYVRPYWITFDGIEVRGNGKYIHVEDGIKGYISIPINLQGLIDNTTGVASGKLEVNYDTTKLKYIDAIADNTDVAYKIGGVFDTAGVRLIKDGNIRCVAIEKVDGIQNIVPNPYSAIRRESEDGMYAYEKINNMYITLRFKPISGEYAVGQGQFMDFNVSNIQFCDEEENLVSVNVWDTRY